MFLIAELSAVGLYEWRGGSRQHAAGKVHQSCRPEDSLSCYGCYPPSPNPNTKLNLGFEPTQVPSVWPYTSKNIEG